MKNHFSLYTRSATLTSLQLLLALLACITLESALAAGDEALRERIELQVQRELRLTGTEVRIIADEGHVVMLGQVRLLSQKMLYEQIAWQTSGTFDIDNEIRVSPATRISDEQLKNAIQALFEHYPQYQNFDVSVKDGVAIIHGTFASATEVLSLKWQIAGIEGILSILIESQFIAQR
jgi:osmotically-inducible protein OsmY